MADASGGLQQLRILGSNGTCRQHDRTHCIKQLCASYICTLCSELICSSFQPKAISFCSPGENTPSCNVFDEIKCDKPVFYSDSELHA